VLPINVIDSKYFFAVFRSRFLRVQVMIGAKGPKTGFRAVGSMVSNRRIGRFCVAAF
jgi:hypothetical protein